MKYIETYFECYKASGMNTVYEFHRMRGNEKVGGSSFDHCQYDGVSAITEMARMYPAEGFKAPVLAMKPKPSLLKRLWELSKWYVRFYPFMPPTWKTFKKHQKEMTGGIVQVENWKSSDNSISLNTKLLYALDKTSGEFLTKPNSPRVWMTPVGLYTEITRDVQPLNRVSFIDIEIKNTTSLTDIQNEVAKQLCNMNYWGTVLTMNLPNLVGKTIFTFLAKHMHLMFRRTGTFSNIGEWTIPGLSEDEWWVMGEGCVVQMSPVDANSLVINGRLGLSVHFHHSIGISNEDAQKFVEKWKDNYLAIK